MAEKRPLVISSTDGEPQELSEGDTLPGADDSKVLLASDDPYSGYLKDKLTAGTGITLTETEQTAAPPMLLQMNGENDSTTITDGGTSAKEWTCYGTVCLKTAVKWAGSASAYFPGSGSNYISTPDHADFDWTAQDGTINMRIYPQSTGNVQGIIGQAWDTQDWQCYLYDDGKIAIGKAGVNEIVSSAGAVAFNAWNHLRITYNNTTGYTRIFINGSQVASGTTAVWSNSSNTLKIGCYSYGATAYPFKGYIDEVKIFPGTILSESAFTPPTAEWVAGGNTLAVSVTPNTYAAANHNHDSDYSDINHDHDSDYSAIGHDHDLDYSAIGHDHDSDYANISHSHGATTISVHQHTHGLAIGDVVKRASSVYSKAQADSGDNSNVIGIVSASSGADDFVITTEGYVTGLSGLTDNTVYYLSPSSAGTLTATEPSTAGHVRKPLLIADSTTSGYFHICEGAVIGAGVSAHADSHEDGGADELSILDLGGYPADETKVLLGDGSWGDLPTGGGMTTEVLTGSGTWTCPEGVYLVNITACGAGGGGGGGATSWPYSGGGGGAGGGVEKLAFMVTPGNSYSFAIGSAGSGGGANTDGTAGGNTTFDTLTCFGGGGGIGGTSGGSGYGYSGGGIAISSTTAVIAGSGGGSDASGTNITSFTANFRPGAGGGGGGWSASYSGGSNGATKGGASQNFGGGGGSSFWAKGGSGGSTAGDNATVGSYGSGGGGGAGNGSGAGKPGKAGGAGFLILEYTAAS